jgi:hypothetical protein
MRDLTAAWRKHALARGGEDLAQRWELRHAFANPTGADRPDPYRVGQAWYDLVRPTSPTTGAPTSRACATSPQGSPRPPCRSPKSRPP